MPDPSRSSEPESASLENRLAQLGRTLGEREAAHRAALDAARDCAVEIRERVASALEHFHAAAAEAGAPHLRIDVSDIRADDKHLRAVEFDLQRGRYKAIVTAKSRGEVTLVGPFRLGKVEGPCLSFPFDATAELGAALEDFLARFLEEAATP